MEAISKYIVGMAAEKAYKLLTNGGDDSFSEDFPIIKLIDGLLDHFVALEDYDKCIVLRDIQQDYIQAKINETFENKPSK